MKLGILGSDGLPARYGGFETFVEQVSTHLVNMGHEVLVIGSAIGRPKDTASGVLPGIKTINLPMSANGIASIPFDCFSILLASRRVDSILMLGVSAGALLPFFRRIRKGRPRFILNVDGLESRRDKWHGAAKSYLRVAERMAVRDADAIVSDNAAIADIVREQYGRQSAIIAYGNDQVVRLNPSVAAELVRGLGLEPGKYLLTVARIEPENNISEMIEARLSSNIELTYAIVGNLHSTGYGKSILQKFGNNPRIRFLGPIYDAKLLGALRGCAGVYLHGHKVGGTNPSLVEMLPYRVPIVAFDCVFNRSTLDGECGFFSGSSELQAILDAGKFEHFAPSAALISDRRYSWREIAKAYADLLTLPAQPA